MSADIMEHLLAVSADGVIDLHWSTARTKNFSGSTGSWSSHSQSVIQSNFSLSLCLPPSLSLQEFEAEYQELWDWLMDMDAMVVDSHQLMMSEEQRRHLYKVESVGLTEVSTSHVETSFSVNPASDGWVFGLYCGH